MENRCVACGVIIPEGREICPNCEAGYIGKQVGTVHKQDDDGEWHSEPLIIYDERQQ